MEPSTPSSAEPTDSNVSNPTGTWRGHFVPLQTSPRPAGCRCRVLRSASNAAHLTLRLRHSGGNARFRRAQNTAPSGVSRPFFGAGEHSLRLFLQEVRAQTARPLPGYAVVLLMWRSLQGLGRRFWITDGTSLKVPGRLAGIPLFGSCMACGLVLDASHLAGELALTRSRLVLGCRLALAGPWPGATHENEPAATGQKTVQVALPDIQNGLKRPRKDLHTSGITKAFVQRSCGLRSHLLQKQAEGVLSRPKKGAGDAGRSGILRPPEPRITSRMS